MNVENVLLSYRNKVWAKFSPSVGAVHLHRSRGIPHPGAIKAFSLELRIVLARAKTLGRIWGGKLNHQPWSVNLAAPILWINLSITFQEIDATYPRYKSLIWTLSTKLIDRLSSATFVTNVLRWFFWEEKKIRRLLSFVQRQLAFGFQTAPTFRAEPGWFRHDDCIGATLSHWLDHEQAVAAGHVAAGQFPSFSRTQCDGFGPFEPSCSRLHP